MYRPDHRSVCRPSLALLGALAWLASGLSTPDVQAQPPAPKKVQLTFCIVASERADKAAFETARKYFAGLKDNKDQQKQEDDLRDKGESPLYPNPAKPKPAGGPPKGVERILGAALLPQLGLGDAVLSAALLAGLPKADKPSEEPATASYRWGQLPEPALQILGLTAAAKNDPNPLRKKAFETATKATEAHEPFVHPAQGWLIYGRPAKEGAETSYFVLVREPATGKEITETQLKRARLVPDLRKPYLLVECTDEGKKRLEQFTEANKPQMVEGKKVYSFVAIVIGSRVGNLFGIREPIPDGTLKLAGRSETELAQVADAIQKVLPRP